LKHISQRNEFEAKHWPNIFPAHRGLSKEPNMIMCGQFFSPPTDYEIGRCAEIFIAHYGPDAASMAEARANDLYALGVQKAAEKWVQIKTEIDRLAAS
jgi:hypothetical protein